MGIYRAKTEVCNCESKRWRRSVEWWRFKSSLYRVGQVGVAEEDEARIVIFFYLRPEELEEEKVGK